MDNTNIAKSFQPQKELNPKIWEEVDGEYKMNPNVRKGLLKVASSFYDTIKVEFLMEKLKIILLRCMFKISMRTIHRVVFIR